jgi:hypothetical protein
MAHGREQYELPTIGSMEENFEVAEAIEKALRRVGILRTFMVELLELETETEAATAPPNPREGAEWHLLCIRRAMRMTQEELEELEQSLGRYAIKGGGDLA